MALPSLLWKCRMKTPVVGPNRSLTVFVGGFFRGWEGKPFGFFHATSGVCLRTLRKLKGILDPSRNVFTSRPLHRTYAPCDHNTHENIHVLKPSQHKATPIIPPPKYPRHIQPRGGTGMLALSIGFLLRPQRLDVPPVRHRHLPAAGFRLRLLLRLRGRNVHPVRANQRLHGVPAGLLQRRQEHELSSLHSRHGWGECRERRRLRAVLGRRILERGRIDHVRAVPCGNGVRCGPGGQ